MLKAKFTPPKMKTIKLWAGLYGGHYDVIVFFHKKPTNRMDDKGDTRSKGEYVDCLAEHEASNIYGDMGTGNFEIWFPDVDLSPYTQENGRPKDTEVPYKDLFRIELTLPVDEYGDAEPFTMKSDW